MKLKDGVGDRIKEKLDLLKTRAGHKKVISDLLFPSREKKKNRQIALAYADVLDEKIKELEPLIRSMRSHTDYIGDPDKFVAAYLLIGKSYTSLKAVAILVRQGYSFQIAEIVRSSMESLHLAALFLEDGQEKLVQNWFGGEIIGNKTAREVLGAAVNEVNKTKGDEPVPIQEALSDVYSIYSSYTHSGYVALFDFIDVFLEDFDFQQNSQFHYNRKNLHLIDNLYVNILLELKNFYIRAKDEENLAKVEVLLAKEDGSFASPEEIDEEFKRYK
ncbi:MAG: hypothetical protein COW87_02290 [Candidatus Levybacteria bacterium CG22_combo_CG10-13_8_21_14_all_35_11]|nr:MAG: hypothetical protein COW87_02290 [Candidatus Levybacteria bacterium CG22_combo_CG10-13_8_21_14_all_35_11]